MSFRNPTAPPRPAPVTATTSSQGTEPTNPIGTTAKPIGGTAKPFGAAGRVRPAAIGRAVEQAAGKAAKIVAGMDEKQKLGVVGLLLAAYIFMVFSRLPELIGYYLGNLRIILVLALVLSLMAAIRGGLGKALLCGPGIAITLFTLWLIFCIPSSVWRGGSFRTVFLEWSVSLGTYYFTAALLTRFRECDAAAKAIAWGVVMIVAMYLVFGTGVGGRVGMAFAGTLGNANLFALQLLMGLPFCVYICYRIGMFSAGGVFWLVVMLAGLGAIGKSGSRSGLLALGMALLLLFFRMSIMGKARLIFLTLGIVLAGLAALPRSALVRYMTLFTSDPNLIMVDDDAISAQQSASLRRQHLIRSLKLTLQNPVVGVGPGQYMVAAAESGSKETVHQHTLWIQTHNTYTQVSSEAGIPGMLLYLAFLLTTMRKMLKLYRFSKDKPQFRTYADLSFCILLAMATTLVNAFFASIAYGVNIPMLCGVAVGVSQSATEAIGEMQLSQKMALAK